MKPPKRPFLIAITGGIASGKSIAVKVFRQNHIKVWETDKIGHEVLEQPEVKTRLATHFGNDIVQNGKVNREQLGQLVFADKEKRKLLNAIVHPQVLKYMQLIVDTSNEKFLVFEIPLLFELRLSLCFDLIIHIYCTEFEQIKRLEKRNNLKPEEAKKRIQAQLPYNEKMKQADVNIENNQSISLLERNILNVIKKLPKYSYKSINPLFAE